MALTMPEELSEIARGIAAGLEDAIAHAKGESERARLTTYVCADAKALREETGLTQTELSRPDGIPNKEMSSQLELHCKSQMNELR